VLGVATGIFLFTIIEIMQSSLADATELSGRDTTLVVYRQNRFCPFASRLPQDYDRKIRSIPGVREVVPIKIVVNNCSTSLDVVTFRGLPREKMQAFSKQFRLLEGSLDDWARRSDAAIVGKTLADRRRVKLGDKLDAAGISVTVAGVIESDNAQNMNVAYTHLDFLQQASKTGLGIVTQFNVLLDDHTRLAEVAGIIDDLFKDSQDPTQTSPEKAFVARTIGEITLLIKAGRYVGFAAIAMVFALVCNTIAIAVRSRIREYAVLQTIGFEKPQIAWMIIVEGSILGLSGGILGIGVAILFISIGHFSITSEALSIVFKPDLISALFGLLISLLLGIVSGILPSVHAVRENIVNNLRDE
jgi:putative ABC transport system permease protein